MKDRPTGEALLDALERGELRVAEPREPRENGGWVVHGWVREELLALFRSSEVVPIGTEIEGRAAFRDKAAFPLRRFTEEDAVRLVPGGSAIRRSAYVGPNVVCMPPMYVNVGAYVGAGSMIDSHALVGSCAQLGERVHLSAAAQLGGVLEPPSARPVIVEDEAFIGGNCGVYEGVLIGRRAVLAAGVVLTASTRVFDLVHERELTGTADAPLEIPAEAVVVPGSRPASGDWARERGLQAACCLIVKYRDERTDVATLLEDALR